MFASATRGLIFLTLSRKSLVPVSFVYIQVPSQDVTIEQVVFFRLRFLRKNLKIWKDCVFEIIVEISRSNFPAMAERFEMHARLASEECTRVVVGGTRIYRVITSPYYSECLGCFFAIHSRNSLPYGHPRGLASTRRKG